MVLVSSVTAAVSAKALPQNVAPVSSVMLLDARIFPKKAVSVPSVAELPTCQNTPVPAPPLTTSTAEPLAVVRVLPIWKTQNDRGSFGGKGKFPDSYAARNELFCVMAGLPTGPASGALNVAGRCGTRRRTAHSRGLDESLTERFRSLLPIPIGSLLALDTTRRPRHSREAS